MGRTGERPLIHDALVWTGRLYALLSLAVYGEVREIIAQKDWDTFWSSRGLSSHEAEVRAQQYGADIRKLLHDHG